MQSKSEEERHHRERCRPHNHRLRGNIDLNGLRHDLRVRRCLQSDSHVAEEEFLFPLRELSDAPLSQAPIFECNDADAPQALHRVSILLTHTADLAMAPFGEGEGEGDGIQTFRMGQLGAHSFQPHPLREFAQEPIRKGAIERDLVLLLVIERGMREPVREDAVVGEEEQSR